jgi:hypothetical protein
LPENGTKVLAFPGSSPPGGALDEAKFRDALRAFADAPPGNPPAPAHPRVAYKPDGVHFTDVAFDFPVTLASRRLPFGLHFERCEFRELFDARWAALDSLVLRNCTLRKAFRGTALEARGNVDLTSTRSLSQIDLSHAVLRGDLVLIGADLSYSRPEWAVWIDNDVRVGSALFCAGISAHSILMDGARCKGRFFLEASRLGGILKAGNAILERHDDRRSAKFGKWDYMVMSAADSVVQGAVILGEEAWGEFDPVQTFKAEGQINLSNCRINGDLVCTNGQFHSAYKDATAPEFDEFEERHGTRDQVLLASLNVTQTEIGGGVWLDRGFHSCGEVRFDSSKVNGVFHCTGGQFNGALPRCRTEEADRSRRHRAQSALNIDRIEIGSTLRLNGGFRAFGIVSLRNAIVRGDVTCEGGTFHGCWNKTPEEPLGEEKERQPLALAMSGAEIGGSVFMAQLGEKLPPGDDDLHPLGQRHGPVNPFRSYGQVRLRGTRIGRNLHLGGGRFFVMPEPDADDEAENRAAAQCNGARERRPTQRPLIGWFHSARVHGTTFMTEVDRLPVHICGSMSFAGMQTGGWEDSAACWPQCREDEDGKMATFELNGLTYERLHGPTRGDERLIWLLHQPIADLSLANGKHSTGSRRANDAPSNGHADREDYGLTPSGFKTQPWERCATVLHELGYRTEARYLYRMEQRFIRFKMRLGPADRFVNFLLGTFVGHGYRLMLAISWAVWLVGLGMIVGDWGYSRGYIAPSQEITIEVHGNDYENGFPQGYPSFRPMLFSLDTALPAGNLRQVNYWVAVDNPVTKPPQMPDDPVPRIRKVNDRFAEFQNALETWFGGGALVQFLLSVARAGLGTVLGLVLAYGLYLWPARREAKPDFKRIGFSVSKARELYDEVLNNGRKRIWRRVPPFLVFVMASLFFVCWGTYITSRDSLFWAIDQSNCFLTHNFRVSFAHIWFVVETVLGWLLITAVAVALGSTVFHYRRERL